MKPEVCLDCGNTKIQDEPDVPGCPYCQLPHKLTIAPEDCRFLVFLSLVERIKSSIIAGEIHEFEPTRRELEILKHGDQIVHDNQVFRIMAMSYGLEGVEPKMWICLNHQAIVNEEQSRYHLDPLPPFVPQHALNQIPFEMAIRYRMVPISSNDEEIVVAHWNEDPVSEDEMAFLLGDQKVVFWNTTETAFETALRSYYNEGEIAACGNDLKFQCPRKWADLKPTEATNIRFCEGCNERVHLIENDTDRELFKNQAYCTATHSYPGAIPVLMGVSA